MTAVVREGGVTYPGASALEPYRRVKLASGNLTYSAASDEDVGVTESRTFAAAEVVSVLPAICDKTVRMVGAAAISAGADVYGAASGKVTGTPGGRYIGLAVTACTADGAQFEVMRRERSNLRAVTARTADFTLTAADSGSVNTTDGAGGVVVCSLPVATVGQTFLFRVGAAFDLRLDPNGTEKISLPSTGVPGTAGKYLAADANGESIQIICTKTGEWSVFGHTGTWTAET